MIKKAYLSLYNLASAAGWAYILYLVTTAYLEEKSPEQTWKIVELPLKIVQTAAIMEVVHCLIRLVRSSFLSVAMQVASRLAVLWGVTNASAICQGHISLPIMLTAWSCAEIPRYLFYFFGLIGKVPGPIFWLRYNLFFVLYPVGISAELVQILNALPGFKAESLGLFYLFFVALLLYIPGAPFLYTHMMTQRRKSMRSRAMGPRPPRPPPKGLVWPMTSKTDRSTSTTGRHILADAFAAVDKPAADKVRQERNWRFGYAKHFVRSVELGCRSPETALEMAQAGLKSAHTRFEFIRGEEQLPFHQAMDKYQENTYHTGVLEGSGWGKTREAAEYEVPFKPYASAGKHVPLRGEALKAQLDKWVEYGTIEPEARDAIWKVASSEGWLDLSDKYFVLLGATSAMGPLLVLASLGANIVGIDLDRSGIWDKLTGIIRDSPARLFFPLKKPQAECTDHADLCANAGSNLLEDTPEIRNWLREVVPGEQLIIGNYAYLDGELHVRLSVAMDAICGGVCEARPDTMLGYLCSPTDVFVMPDACRQAMQHNCRSSPLWQKAVSSLTRFLTPNARKPTIAADGKKFCIVDGLVVAQGPNYALAKRLQHWRAMLARSKGHSVSTNIAPSTATQSVVHNSQFAAAYGGMHHFRPMAIMYQETSNAVMGALLLHDVWNDDGVARPDTPLDNPLQLFGSGAFHGGIWRCGYKIGSIGEMSALIYYLHYYRLPLLASLAAIGGSGYYVANNGAPHQWF